MWSSHKLARDNNNSSGLLHGKPGASRDPKAFFIATKKYISLQACFYVIKRRYESEHKKFLKIIYYITWQNFGRFISDLIFGRFLSHLGQKNCPKF